MSASPKWASFKNILRKSTKKGWGSPGAPLEDTPTRSALSTALAMTEAAYVEAKRQSGLAAGVGTITTGGSHSGVRKG